MIDLNKFSKKRISVAVSGGIDSISLLHYLKSRQREYGYFLTAVHCEHGIRGEESIADWKFVEALCEKWNIPIYFFSENCINRAKEKKESLETAARNFRYESFKKLIEEDKTEFIATAHHLDDEAETVLFRLCRGTSLTGVQGIGEENGYILRPFLGWTRADIEKYCQENRLEYRVDSTNLEKDATRNILRQDVLPVLENAIPASSKNLVRFARLAGEDDALLYEYAESLLSYETVDGDEQIRVEFCAQKPIFRRACLMAMKYLGIDRDYTTLHLESVYALQRLERGACTDLPKNIQARKTSTGIVFFEKKQEAFRKNSPEKFCMNGFDGGRYEVKCSLTPIIDDVAFKTLRVDLDKIPKNALFRFREEGDEIQRFGGGRKTLKKFFNEEKIEVNEREYLPLIADENGEVYVVCGIEISEKVKVTEETKTLLYISLRKKKEKTQ